jgi:hypothetical protein
MTTRRFFMSAFLTASLLAGRLTSVRADTGPNGLPICCCAYNAYFCTYNDGSYWSECDSTYDIGQLWTFMARARCQNWHPAP